MDKIVENQASFVTFSDVDESCFTGIIKENILPNEEGEAYTAGNNQVKTVTTDGDVVPDEGYTGLSKVIVNTGIDDIDARLVKIIEQQEE